MVLLSSHSWPSGLGLALMLLGCGEGMLLPAGTLRFAAPADGEILAGEVKLQLESEATAGAREVLFWVNDRLVTRDDAPPFEAVLDTTGWPEGEVHLGATLASGASEAPPPGADSAKLRAIVDNRGPAITWLAPTAEACLSPHGKLELSVSADDAVGISMVEFRIASRKVATLRSAPYSHTLDLASLAPLPAELKVTVAAENQRKLISNHTQTLPICP